MWILQGINSCFPAVGFRNISGYCVGAVDAWRSGAGRHQSNINKKEDFIRLKNRSNGQHAEVSLLLKSICFVKLRLRVGGGKRQIQQNVTISQADHPPTLQTDLNSFFFFFTAAHSTSLLFALHDPRTFSLLEKIFLCRVYLSTGSARIGLFVRRITLSVICPRNPNFIWARC